MLKYRRALQLSKHSSYHSFTGISFACRSNRNFIVNGSSENHFTPFNVEWKHKHKYDSNYDFFLKAFGCTGFIFSLASLLTLQNYTENCGIVGVVGSDDCSGFLMEGKAIADAYYASKNTIMLTVSSVSARNTQLVHGMFLFTGLTILRNRGYDSVGVATVSEGSDDLYVTKYASRDTTCDSIDLVRNNIGKHVGHFTG
jgi:hypothetical protein